MTIKLQHDYDGDGYAKAQHLEELGGIIFYEDEKDGPQCVLGDKDDELGLELGDYLDEVLVDPTPDAKARVIRGYRWARDKTPLADRIREVHPDSDAKAQPDGSVLMRCPSPDHPDMWASFLIDDTAGKCMSCGHETTVRNILTGT